jgi:hypothetical protein
MGCFFLHASASARPSCRTINCLISGGTTDIFTTVFTVRSGSRSMFPDRKADPQAVAEQQRCACAHPPSGSPNRGQRSKADFQE